MIKLLKKEIRLTAQPLSFIFVMFSLMAFVPGYPILCGAFFLCLGIFFSFQNAREQNDILYTALLPVKKSDTVISKYIFTVMLQCAYLLFSVLFTAVRMTVLSGAKPYLQNAMMNANLAYLGFIFICFALFNLIFVNGFFKTAYKLGKPFMIFAVAEFIFIGFAETLHHIKGLKFLNTSTEKLGVQALILIFGGIVYVIFTAIAVNRSKKSFEKIDL
ncbi:MAG: ABC-2 transporter permease [Eubacterium sp.]